MPKPGLRPLAPEIMEQLWGGELFEKLESEVVLLESDAAKICKRTPLPGNPEASAQERQRGHIIEDRTAFLVDSRACWVY